MRGKMVALLGVDGLVVVETDDCLLITTRERSQDVSKVVKAVHEGLGREGSDLKRGFELKRLFELRREPDFVSFEFLSCEF